MRVRPIPGVEQTHSIDDQASAIVLDRRLADIAQQTEIEFALDEQQVERRLAAAVVALASDSVQFADGSHLDVDAVVMCTGMAAASLPDPLDGERDALGRYIVNATLEHPTVSGVFVTGDMASADTGTGQPTLQSCQHALPLGRAAGENAARHCLGQELIDYQQPAYVTCLDLGDHGAVRTTGWDREVVETGAAAKAIKQLINQKVIYADLSGGAEGLLEQSQLGFRRPTVPVKPTG